MVLRAESRLEVHGAAPTPVAAAETIDGVAAAMKPLVEGLLGTALPLRLEFWDGSSLSPLDPVATLRFTSPDAIRRLLWMPNELGLGRAYVGGDIEVDGNLFEVVTAFRDAKPTGVDATSTLKALPMAVRAAKRSVPWVGRPRLHRKRRVFAAGVTH